mgnify:CR=1 FL=1
MQLRYAGYKRRKRQKNICVRGQTNGAGACCNVENFCNERYADPRKRREIRTRREVGMAIGREACSSAAKWRQMFDKICEDCMQCNRTFDCKKCVLSYERNRTRIGRKSACKRGISAKFCASDRRFSRTRDEMFFAVARKQKVC